MIIDNYAVFIDLIISKLLKLGIDVSGYQLDHFGYQASSDADYDRLKPQFSEVATLMSEELVGGRRVGIYKFLSPLAYKNIFIPAVELIAPKTGQVCPSALEHAEFVITEDFQTFINRFPGLDWDLSKINQPKFPMVNLPLGDNTQAKFHHTPVLEIITNNPQ